MQKHWMMKIIKHYTVCFFFFWDVPHLFSYSVPVQVALTLIHTLLVQELALVRNKKSIAYKLPNWNIPIMLTDVIHIYTSLPYTHLHICTAWLQTIWQPWMLTQATVRHHNVRVTAALFAAFLAPVLDADGLVGLHNICDLQLWVHLKNDDN